MTSTTFVILSGVLSFGAPLAFAVYEIVTLRRSPRGGDDDRRTPPQPTPLPNCLQPHVLLARGPIREFTLVD